MHVVQYAAGIDAMEGGLRYGTAAWEQPKKGDRLYERKKGNWLYERKKRWSMEKQDSDAHFDQWVRDCSAAGARLGGEGRWFRAGWPARVYRYRGGAGGALHIQRGGISNEHRRDSPPSVCESSQ